MLYINDSLVQQPVSAMPRLGACQPLSESFCWLTSVFAFRKALLPSMLAATACFAQEQPADAQELRQDRLVLAVVAAADLDQDGDSDLVWSDGKSVRVFEHDGALRPGFLQSPLHSSSANVSALAVADLDGDGSADIVTLQAEGDLSWHENLSGLSLEFGKRLIDTIGPGPTALEVADVDADGDIDIVVGGGGGDAALLVRKFGWRRSAF